MFEQGKPDLPPRQPSGDAEDVVGHSRLKVMERAGEMRVGVINIQNIC